MFRISAEPSRWIKVTAPVAALARSESSWTTAPVNGRVDMPKKEVAPAKGKLTLAGISEDIATLGG